MKVIYQRRKNDCAISCFAMLMDISYERAAWLIFSWKLPFYWLFDKTTKVKYIVAASKKLNRELGMYKSMDLFKAFDYEHDAILILSYGDLLETSHAVIWKADTKATVDPNINHSYLDLELLKNSEVYLLVERAKVRRK